MAALLRQGARRIGGSLLQRTQAAVTSPAVAEERRGLLSRRMYFTKKQVHGRIKREVQQKKDELYDLIIKGEKRAATSTWPNAWLLQYLAEDITPRPSDSIWCNFRKTKTAISWCRRVCLFTLIYVAVDFYDEQKVALAMMREDEEEEEEEEEEEHEASKVETVTGLEATQHPV